MSPLDRLRRHFEALRRRTIHAPFPDDRGIEARTRRNSRRRPPGMAPALVEPPRGPLPLAGGAEAPLIFERD